MVILRYYTMIEKLKRLRCEYKILVRKYFESFRLLKTIQLCMGIGILVLTFAPCGFFGAVGGIRDPKTGFIIDVLSSQRTEMGIILTRGVERAIVANNALQLLSIVITRFTAFFMYPALILVYLTKLRGTINLLIYALGPFACPLLYDLHELHIYCAWVVLINGVIHAAFHLIRWANQSNLSLLFHHFSGISGLIMLVSLLLVSLPMAWCRGRICYEIRKKLHYAFLFFNLAFLFHTPTSTIPNGGFSLWISSVLSIWYFLDAIYVRRVLTERAEVSRFQIIKNSGFQMTVRVSKRFTQTKSHGGYCYVCFPWMKGKEWHVFSLFENKSLLETERNIFILKVGDWTEKAYNMFDLLRDHGNLDSGGYALLQGPFYGPYDHALRYENLLLVASGIGITPALSVVSRRVKEELSTTNMVWIVRNSFLLNHFLSEADFCPRGLNMIFYTGQHALDRQHNERPRVITKDNGATILLFHSRPDLEGVIQDVTLEKMKNHSSFHHLRSSILYCCGSTLILSKLRCLGKKHGIPVHSECFSW